MTGNPAPRVPAGASDADSPTRTPVSRPDRPEPPQTRTAPRPQDAAQIPDAPPGWPCADDDAMQRARTDGGTRALLARAMWRRDYQPGPEANVGGMVYEIADRIAELAVPEIERQVRAKVTADMKRAAAGRRDYASRASEHIAAELEAEAAAYDTAARIAEAPTDVMWALLPLTMWTEEDRRTS